jgi:hypothetical protein
MKLASWSESVYAHHIFRYHYFPYHAAVKRRPAQVALVVYAGLHNKIEGIKRSLSIRLL